ncbi:hypothetical protein FB566_0453 [Stackebrandtia endophytica]|uniref:Uncharacterized protein n=1 Tax=Stackebrandtia endophytica TaxID=1496996 RepID=A0A543AQW4_9ACTN|nr:hypothetical protein FB566_0453 [Stackebrandtia endophytica]
MIAGWTTTAAASLFAAFWQDGIPKDLLGVILTVLGWFTDQAVPFKVDPLGIVIRLLVLVSAVFLGYRTLRYQRRSRGDCERCGIPATPRDLRRAARIAAVASIPAIAGYAALKLHWAFGGDLGVADTAAFADVDLVTPGYLDTVLLSVVGIGLVAAMIRRWRLPRWSLVAAAFVGLAMLLPVSLLGIAYNVIMLFDPPENPLLAPWAGWFVYLSFGTWAVCLLIVTLDYLAATARPCRCCGRTRYARIAA